MLFSPLARRRTLSALSFSALALAAATAQAQTTTPVTNVPRGVSESTYVGKPSPSQVLHFAIAFPPKDRAALQSYVGRISNPKDVYYRRFLTPTQVGDKFGPSATTVNAVTSYLTGKGFKIKLVNGSRFSFLADATVKQAESAFSTTFGNYKLTKSDDNVRPTFYANTTALKLPKALASTVLTISGGTNSLLPRPAILDVTQTRSLYNTAPYYDSGFQGNGMKIGMVNYDGYRLSNVPLFYTKYSLPTPTGGVGSNILPVSIAGSNGNTQSGIDGEGDLDIQMILGMAPLSTLVIYDGANASVLDMYTQQANDNLCDVISESWEYGFTTDDDAEIQSLHDEHLQMSAQGITFCSAAGDFGAQGRSTPYPHFDSEVLQIGGTIATVDGSGSRNSEVAWSTVSGDPRHLGGGGGYIGDNFTLNVRPTYQSPTDPDYAFTFRSDLNKRLFPDISFNAAGDNGAYYFYSGGSLQTGAVGTSFASPIFAGMLGVTLEKLIDDGYFDAGEVNRLGRLQDLIYQQMGRADVYHDIIEGGIGPLPDGTQANAQVGWDFATGWGAVDMGAFHDALLEGASVSVLDTADDASIYATTTPQFTYGTTASGDASALTTTDGIAYSVTSKKQNGVGQVAAAEIGFALQGTADVRRSASARVVFESDHLSVGYLYLYNVQTSTSAKPVYDLVKTVPVTGSMVDTTLAVDLDKYVAADNSVRMLVRALKPARLGNAPITLTIDQATVTERVKPG